MPMVRFTQYLLPHGEKKDCYIDRPEEITAKVAEIEEAGLHLEIEVLRDGCVSMTIGDEDGDWFHEICPNGFAVPGTVDRLINSYSPEALAQARQDAGA